MQNCFQAYITECFTQRKYAVNPRQIQHKEYLASTKLAQEMLSQDVKRDCLASIHMLLLRCKDGVYYLRYGLHKRGNHHVIDDTEEGEKSVEAGDCYSRMHNEDSNVIYPRQSVKQNISIKSGFQVHAGHYVHCRMCFKEVLSL